MTSSFISRNSIIEFCSILIYLIPLALLTGPFIPDLFISLISIIFITLSFKENLWEKYYKNYFLFIFLIFILFLFLSSFVSENTISSLQASFFYFRFGIFSLALWFLIDQNKFLIKKFSIFLLITFILALLDGFYQIFNDSNFFGFTNITENRMTLLLNDKQILGGYLSRLFPLLFGTLIYSFNLNIKKIICLMLLLIITDVIIYISGERTAIGLLLLETVMIIIFLSKFKILRLISLVLSIGIIMLITFFNSEVRERNINKTLEQLNFDGLGNEIIDSDKKQFNLFSPQHESHIVTSYKMFLESPFFGIGPGQFRNFCNDDRYYYNKLGCSTHPHNSYMQVLSELGIIGFMFIFSAFFYVLISLIFQLKKMSDRNLINIKDFRSCLLISFTLSLWPILPTQDFFNNWINIIYYLPVGFYLHLLHKKN